MRRKVLGVIRTIITALDRHIAPAVPICLKYLPVVWEKCAKEQNLLRQTVLQVVGALTGALKELSLKLQNFVLPVLGFSLQKTESSAYLYQEALELWHCVLINTPSLNDPLVRLLPPWLKSLSEDSEDLRLPMEIV